MAFGNATKGYVKKHSGGGGGGGTTNYNDLSNKPSINGVTLSGNKTSGELNITATLTLTECTTDYDSTYTRYYVPKTAKLVTFVAVNSQANENYRMPYVLSIKEIETALTNHYILYFVLFNGEIGEVSVNENENYYILTYNYATSKLRMRDVFYI